jgi:hypothetical protein
LAYKNLGSYYMTSGNLKRAQEYGLKSLAMAKEMGDPRLIRLSAGLLWTIYKMVNKPAQALEMYELHVLME